MSLEANPLNGKLSTDNHAMEQASFKNYLGINFATNKNLAVTDTEEKKIVAVDLMIYEIKGRKLDPLGIQGIFY